MMKASEFRSRYYNMRMSAWDLWHHDISSSISVGQKISRSKKGKSTKPCSLEKAATISAAKKASFQKRRDELGYAISPEISKKMGIHNIGRKHTDEWKEQNSIRMKEQWKSGKRKKINRSN
jgi:hypothetical protein